MSSPTGANIADAAALADELARFRVVEPARLAELSAKLQSGKAAALAEHLIRSGALTPFQAQRALAGEARLLALGPYRLTGMLGRGTFGPLYTATHTSKPGLFNVRVLPLRNLWKAQQAKQLARTLAAAVTHAAVAPLVEVDSANGFHYLVWPDTAGERLTDRVNGFGPLAAGAAATVCAHLASALFACHANLTPHGALTPQAVAITPSGRPCLLELGAGALLAQSLADDESLLDSLSSAFASAAVLTFAAPELAAEPQALTAAADQYALGAVGYFAVTGLSPYPHPMLAEQLRAKRVGAPPSAAIVNPAVPAELAAVFERMMAPNPADRFATLADVEEQLAALATVEQAPTAEPPVESLRLAKIQEARAIAGAVAWTAPGSERNRPPARDGSGASVTFDLPDAPATTEEPARDPIRNRAFVETPASVPSPTRLTAPAPASKAPRDDQVSEAEASGVPPALAPTPEEEPVAEEDAPEEAAPGPVGAPGGSALWKKMKRNLMFWQAITDTVQVSVFGPSGVIPGQTVGLTVFLHAPADAASVRTLSRAFQHGAELIGTGCVSREVARATELAVHLSVANAGVVKTLVRFEWRGQPQRLGFELHVPWESPEGPSPGLVSVGLNNVRIGKIEFCLNVLPRKA